MQFKPLFLFSQSDVWEFSTCNQLTFTLTFHPRPTKPIHVWCFWLPPLIEQSYHTGLSLVTSTVILLSWSLNSFLALMPDNLRLYVTAHICKLSQWKQVQQMKICFLLGIAKPASQQRHIWIATHYYTFSIPPPFLSIATGTAAPLLNYFIFKSCPCAGWNKINTSGGATNCTSQASFECHGVIFYVHNDDINTCVRNQRDYTLELFEWVEEGFRVRMWEWRKVKERLYGFHVSVPVIFPVM